jgi:hypothetical protein
MNISKRSAMAKIGAALGAVAVVPRAARADAKLGNPESRVLAHERYPDLAGTPAEPSGYCPMSLSTTSP